MVVVKNLTLDKLVLVVFGGIIVVLLIIITYNVLGYFALRESTILDVMEKKTVEEATEKCIYAEKYATCSEYVTITNTHYIIVTANEEFNLNEKLYNKIEVDRRYEVVVTGWKNTETLRNIIEVTE